MVSQQKNSQLAQGNQSLAGVQRNTYMHFLTREVVIFIINERLFKSRLFFVYTLKIKHNKGTFCHLHAWTNHFNNTGNKCMAATICSAIWYQHVIPVLLDPKFTWSIFQCSRRPESICSFRNKRYTNTLQIVFIIIKIERYF